MTWSVREGGGGMAITTLPERVLEAEPEVVQVPKYLLDELQQIVKHAEAEPELVHWYHFVPCAGVRYYAYHIDPSPVEPLVWRRPAHNSLQSDPTDWSTC